MKTNIVRRRDAAKSSRRRVVRPVVEGLEDRMLLYATTGDHFVFGSRITWSIVPDGTNLGGVTSNLYSAFDQKFGAGNWEAALNTAFATWENVANINFSQVGDDGSGTETGNYQQSAPNFGDIRISGYSQNQSILAYTLLPPTANGGSDSGDIFLNTNELWQMGSNYDLETVMIHEVGHALGLGHSADSSTAMYTFYTGVKQYVQPDDINGIQSIWGARAEDGIAQGTSNFSSAAAADISKFINGSNNQIVLPNQDVASSSEAYWFKFTTPANASSNLAVQIQSKSLSMLSPRVALYNANVQGLVQNMASPTTYGAYVTASITNATPNTTYYVKVLGSNAGPSGTGAYAMTVNMGNSLISSVAPPNTTVLAQADQGGGGTYQTIGGANDLTNTPVDIPEAIPVNAILAEGDSLTVLKPTHINVPHPVVHFTTKRTTRPSLSKRHK